MDGQYTSLFECSRHQHQSSIVNGLQVILPELPDSGLGLIMVFGESCMERLMSESKWYGAGTNDSVEKRFRVHTWMLR